MDIMVLSRIIGLDGECVEKLQDFLLEPDGYLNTPGKLAATALFFRSLSESLMEQAKDDALGQVDASGKMTDYGIEFEWRNPHKKKVVDTGALRNRYPSDMHPHLYKTIETRGTMAVREVKDG